MKKVLNKLGIFFRRVGTFFDKIIITPITRLILFMSDFFKNNAKNFDRISGKKSTLLIVSLILAFGVFVLIDGESDVMIDQYAEILYKQPVTAVFNEELYVVEGLPETVDITLVGQKRHIFLAKQIPSKGVSVDLTGLKPGNHKVTLKYTQRLESLDYKLDPSNVTVTIYEKVSATKRLTVDILHQDSLNKTLYIDEVTLDRTDVIVKGAEYKLEQVASVKAMIDVDEMANPVVGDNEIKEVPLVAYDVNGEIVDVEIVPKTVVANVKITSPSKEVPIKIIPEGELAFGKAIKAINTDYSTVTIYGSEEAVAKVDKLEVVINVKDLESNKDFNVTLDKPSGINELSVKNLKVKVEVDNSVTKEFKNISVVVENLGDGLSAMALSQDDRQVTVVVSGSESVINSIDPSSIKAYVDLKKYGVGEHSVDVKVTGSDLKLSYKSKRSKVSIIIKEE